ncbi:unnamed protein product [Spirodela intermedia]|uniref:Uncharacterized protein n=1 Tax=Spirodela intermedia TaxID=51605 RepID=A0A7I8INI7_SPIIN|nr:unnamed protein product [Spirodela intermedia]CAA6658698.1 unnamed protein product [Spirodela intermedia]
MVSEHATVGESGTNGQRIARLEEQIARLLLSMEAMEASIGAVEGWLDATEPVVPEESRTTSWAKVPEHKAFAGVRNAELENFLWDLDQYFRAIHTPEAEKVTLASVYPASDAKLWWCTRTEDLARLAIESCEDFVRELKKQLLLTNSAWMVLMFDF